LSAFEFSLANTANALIIERIPAPELILGAQDRQSLFGFEMNIHFAETLLSIAKKRTIGTAADCVVGQNPMSARGRRCTRDILYNEKLSGNRRRCSHGAVRRQKASHQLITQRLTGSGYSIYGIAV
jgi:hypothetical protein